MKERAYNVRDQEENSDREMKEKCLDANGENDVERKPTSDTVNGNSKSNRKPGVLDNCAKRFGSNKACLILILLCVLLFVFFIIIIALAVRVGTLERRTHPVECVSPECLDASSKLVSNWNTSFDPCNDFWKFSCGEWIRRHPLPDNKGSFGVLDLLKKDVHSHLRHLLDLVPHDATVRDPEWKAQRFYHSCMNVEAVELTDTAFKNKLNEIGGWSLLHNWSEQRWDRNNVIERLHVDFGVSPFFKLIIEADDVTPTRNIIKILPAGLGLPSKSHYFMSPDNKYETIYMKYMDDIARQLGATAAEASLFAKTTFGYEKRLAEANPSSEAYRDPFNHYKRLTIRQLSSLTQTIVWLPMLQKYFPDANIKDTTQVVIFSEYYFTQLSTIVSTSDNRGLNHYLMWQFTLAYAPHLSRNFRDIANNFYQSLEGVPNSALRSEDRWEYCLRVTSDYLGQALGAMYVKKYFVTDYATEADLVEVEIQKSFERNLGSVSWAEDSTTRTALGEKMQRLMRFRGSPQFSKDALSDYYVQLVVQSDFFENIIKGKYFLRKKMEKRLLSQVNQDDSWTIYPQDVEPVYHYHLNHLVVPAGMLQKPLFEPSMPPSVRFGSLGTHIGSEMFKAFDDKGVSYQEMGALKLLLKEQSALRYQYKLQCLTEEMADNGASETGNGNLTVGELVSDIAAVKFAYQAYRNMEREYDLPGIGRSHDQVFFISYAQSMCENIRPEKTHIREDFSTTSPRQKRVENTLRQLPEFAEAFSCSSGSKMRASKSCHIW